MKSVVYSEFFVPRSSMVYGRLQIRNSKNMPIVTKMFFFCYANRDDINTFLIATWREQLEYGVK